MNPSVARTERAGLAKQSSESSQMKASTSAHSRQGLAARGRTGKGPVREPGSQIWEPTCSGSLRRHPTISELCCR